MYRLVDFKRRKRGRAWVDRLEYDPNRTPTIALITHEDGWKSYILSPKGLEEGEEVCSGPDAPLKRGNCLRLCDMPVGTRIHNIEMLPGKGGQLARTAGSCATLIRNRQDNYSQVRSIAPSFFCSFFFPASSTVHTDALKLHSR